MQIKYSSKMPSLLMPRGRELHYVLSLGEQDVRKEAHRRRREIIEVVYALGACGRSYRRETVARLRAAVSEVYSAPRVTAAAGWHAGIGTLPGIA